MKNGILCALLSVAALAGCDPTKIKLAGTDKRIAERVCVAGSSPTCRFDKPDVNVGGDPVILPKRDYQFFRMTRSLSFVDAQGQKWVAPESTLTDGASIPRIFTGIVGNPTEPEFRKAAAVHDAYCGIGNEEGPNYHGAKWFDVHRMFYEALIVGGTPRKKASAMFAAVYLGGPRWGIAPVDDINAVPVAPRQQALRRAVDFIDREDPEFDALARYLLLLEQQLKDLYPPQNKDEESSDYVGLDY